jgi:hypothetical protein
MSRSGASSPWPSWRNGDHRCSTRRAHIPFDRAPARPAQDQRGDKPQGGSVVGHRFHEVSIRITAVEDEGRCAGEDPRANRSMRIMRPPQQGQGCIGLGGAVASAGFAVTVSHGGSRAPSSARARARLAAREP